MKNVKCLIRAVTVSVTVFAILTIFAIAVSAAGETPAAGSNDRDGMYYLSIALCLLPAAACGVVEGLSTGKAVEAISRNPETAPKVQSLLILGLALTESSSIYGFATALILIFVK